jgi:hypothetical protein
MTSIKTLSDLCLELTDALEDRNTNRVDTSAKYIQTRSLIERSRYLLDVLRKTEATPESQSDESLKKIRQTTPRRRLSVIIRTSDSCIDNRISNALWSVLDTNREILESISLPQLLP